MDTTAPAGDSTVFSINASGTGTITGGGAGTVTDALDTNYEMTPGTYSVVETLPAGWDQTGNTCASVSRTLSTYRSISTMTEARLCCISQTAYRGQESERRRKDASARQERCGPSIVLHCTRPKKPLISSRHPQYRSIRPDA